MADRQGGGRSIPRIRPPASSATTPPSPRRGGESDGRCWPYCRRRAVDHIPGSRDRREAARQQDGPTPRAPGAIAVELDTATWRADGLRAVGIGHVGHAVLSLAEKVVRGEACSVNGFLTRLRQLEASRSGETDTDPTSVQRAPPRSPD